LTPSKNSYKQVRLILGDQLNISHSWFSKINPQVLYVMMEIKPESEYVTHHIQKIVGIFLNMRNFASALTEQGHELKYFKISDAENKHSFKENLLQLIKKYDITSGAFMEPDEYRLDEILHNNFADFKMQYSMVSTEHFFTERKELETMFQDKSSYLMENFYRQMRKKHGVLMNNEEPAGGKWNYDKQNRKKLPKKITPPEPLIFKHDVKEILNEIQEAGLESIGEINPRAFLWPADRDEAMNMVDYFLQNLFERFGTYQDAMTDDHWSIFHSRLSFAMNLKLISPKEVVEMAEDYWKQHQDLISISQAEGFIRQILGWREFMRGVYWANMPKFEKLNYFENSRKLPSFFWTGNTKMNCLSRAIKQSLKFGYAHHIQRLMVTGNFALLSGIHPNAVDEWYLGIYVDAFQWVEITNTRGMSQYADGGIVGTKPYISSASYINKMSDHCSSCIYDHKKRTGKDACPFNSLYWRFLEVNQDKLKDNQRMSMMYSVWQKMDKSTKDEIVDQASYYLDYIEEL
jgi:deoxyribodipyrimidine photolyase-related protein